MREPVLMCNECKPSHYLDCALCCEQALLYCNLTVLSLISEGSYYERTRKD